MFNLLANKQIISIIRFLINPFIEFKVEFDQTIKIKSLNKKNLFYALPEPSISELIALDKCAKKLDLESPLSIITGSVYRFICLRPPKFDPIEQKIKRLETENLKEIIELEGINSHIIPVSFYWGKHPDKQKSFFKILFSESWRVSGSLKKFIRIMFHGRALVIQFQKPLKINNLITEKKNSFENSILITRYLRALFRRSKQAALGPDISHRTTLVNSLSRDIEVRKTINQLADGNYKTKNKLKRKAFKYANEICSDLNYPIVRILVRGFSWFWNTRYDGIDLKNIDKIKSLSKNNSLVFVPCHRSHIDYCALSYVLYENGLMLPQIAAGNNLNLPILGRILRGGGAIFMRRSFTQNILYSTIFFQHIKSLMRRGNSIEFFPEGGRSRSGLSLSARPGLISMILRSFSGLKTVNVKIIPVYIGYEKILEGESYRSEILGKPKKGESILDTLKIIKDFNNYLGSVYINFGESIDLSEFLDQELDGEDFYIDSPLERPKWLKDATFNLGEKIMQNINSATAVTGTSLFAISLLTENTQALNEEKLQKRIKMYLNLIKNSESYKDVWITKEHPQDIINKTLNLKLIQQKLTGGYKIFNPNSNEVALLSFYKNNISHLFILFSAICESLKYSKCLSREEIVRLVSLVYPFLKRDFNLIEKGKLTTSINNALNTLIDMGLIQILNKDRLQKPGLESVKLEDYLALCNVSEPSIKRFYIIMNSLWSDSLLKKKELKDRCIKIAKRLEEVEGWPYPEFSDKTKFDAFLDKMIRERLIKVDKEGKLKPSKITERVKRDYSIFFDKDFISKIMDYD